MTSLVQLAQLRALHHRLVNLVGQLDDEDYRTQFHHDLSPAGWHLGHCLWVENYWLRTVIMQDDRSTREDARYYQPQYSPKPERGRKLPLISKQLSRVEKGFEANILLLAGLSGKFDNSHPLMTDDYLIHFLLQHHSQHLETLRMVFTQRALGRHRQAFNPQARLVPASLSREAAVIEAGAYPVGGTPPEAFDNELAKNTIYLENTRVARRPVSNAEYLAFMEDGGYQNPELWDETGRAWLENHSVRAPDHWRCDRRGWWYGIGLEGPRDLEARAAVYGISHHEARAFARWAGARLPHEYAWETAARLNLISLTDQVWEWCDNPFFPYDGFKPFPYQEYSAPWFDGTHFTLRGASRFTPAHTRRPSFRNFYTPDKRHIFAGLRLAF